MGPDGTPAPFNFGNVSGAFSTGGDGETAQSDLDHLTIPLHTFTFFGYGRYKLTSNISASIELNYGKSFSKNNSYVYNRYGNLPIASDNAYLPQSIKDQMANLGYPYVFVGTNNMNNMRDHRRASDRQQPVGRRSVSGHSGFDQPAPALSRRFQPGRQHRRQLVVERLFPAWRGQGAHAGDQ